MCAIVATAIKRVSGIDCETENKNIPLKPSLPKKSKLDTTLVPSIAKNIKIASFITSLDPRLESLKVEPMWMKNIGTKKPNPKLESLCGKSFL